MTGKSRRNLRQITLARAISKFGWGSRTEAVKLILHGRVRVNAKIVRLPSLWIDPAEDRISLDGKVLQRKKFKYLVMNKPAGVVTTRADELGRRTVYDLLPGDSQRLFPIGRLDRDTSGLLLFTNDTRFGETVTNPVTKISKTYRVVVDRNLDFEDKKKMESPFRLNEKTMLHPAKVSASPSNPRQFEITIVEGKNRQIRRMCERLGYQILSLCRISIGAVKLGKLKEGSMRSLTKEERDSVISFAKA